MLSLTERFRLPVFSQPTQGKLVFQDQSRAVRRDVDMATMAGALRISGGVQAITDALMAELPPLVMRFNTRVTGLRSIDVQGVGDQIDVTVQSGANQTVERFSAVIVAAPPRVVARDITLEFDGGAALGKYLATVPTWMAGQAKIVAVYRAPFWRNLGLNGDAISHAGPMSEVHDASAGAICADGNEHGALFGFITPKPDWDPKFVQTAALDQLCELFGKEAQAPIKMLYQNWSADKNTATRADQQHLQAHPRYGLPQQIAMGLPRHVALAGTEMAAHDGGFLEGAVNAGAHAANQILNYF
jgi:monoamine oxidase